MRGKKGQPSGAPAASLLVVIVAFILVFILLIPAEDRERLIEGTDEDAVVGEAGSDFGVLLEERPGTLTKLKEREFEHRIPSFNIFTTREDVVLKSVDSVFVESGGVSTRAVPIFVEGGASNGRLAFSVKEFSGRLAIDFNGEEVFKGEINNILEPLALENIGSENVLQFSVDQPPAWKFWEKNFYEIRDVKVTGTVERTDRQEAINTFFMGSEEADIDNIEEAFIIYLADCRIREAGRLSVFLNGNLISSKVPDCGSLEKTFIDPADFVEGKNELRFVAEEGRYLIDQVFIKTELRKPIFPVYFFDLNESQFRKVENDTINASIRLGFIDDDERKNAVIEVNNHRIFLDTRAGNFSRNIDPFVVEGSNFIRIVPERTLHVVNLEVVLDCKRRRDCA